MSLHNVHVSKLFLCQTRNFFHEQTWKLRSAFVDFCSASLDMILAFLWPVDLILENNVLYRFRFIWKKTYSPNLDINEVFEIVYCTVFLPSSFKEREHFSENRQRVSAFVLTLQAHNYFRSNIEGKRRQILTIEYAQPAQPTTTRNTGGRRQAVKLFMSNVGSVCGNGRWDLSRWMWILYHGNSR